MLNKFPYRMKVNTAMNKFTTRRTMKRVVSTRIKRKLSKTNTTYSSSLKTVQTNIQSIIDT